MIATVVDTHALIWYLAGDRRLSNRAKSHLENIASQGFQIAVSSISLIEIIYLSEKGRIASDWPQRVLGLFEGSSSLFADVPIDAEIARALASLKESGIADMPDRIVAATAVRLEVPLVTRDRAIVKSPVTTIW